MELKELMDIYRKEKMSPYLQDLEDDFYQKVRALLSRLESEFEAERGGSKQGRLLKELDNAGSIIKELYEIRERKVVLSALNYVRREDEEMELESYTPEEERMLEEVASILKENRRAVLERESGGGKKAKKAQEKKAAAPEKKAPAAEPKEAKKEKKISLVTVRITKDLPSIVGVDGKIYGEFAEEDVVSLPDANARALIEQGAAEEIKL